MTVWATLQSFAPPWPPAVGCGRGLPLWPYRALMLALTLVIACRAVLLLPSPFGHRGARVDRWQGWLKSEEHD